MKLYNILLAFLLALPTFLFSQNILTQKQAVSNTLANNYGIRVAKNDVEVAINNTDRGANGYMPTLNASAGPTGNFGGSTQTFNGPIEDVEISNEFSWGANASVGANYTLFDQSRDFTLEQLKEVVNLSDLQLRQTMEGSLLQVFSGYYEVARLSENIDVLAQTLEVSRRRLSRAEYRFEFGQGNRIDALNAQVDIQRDSVNLLNAQQQLANAKRNLNFLMGVPVDTDFQVDTSVTYVPALSEPQLVSDAKNKNIAILAADQNLVIREMDLKIIDATKKPTVGSNLNYTYTYSKSAPGSFIASSTNRGFNGSITLNWNIFDGGRRNIQTQNTQLAIQSQLVQKEQLEQELERDVRNAWEAYQNALFVLDVERQALATNQQNLERTQQLFEAGQVSSVEFRQAQLNQLNSTVSFNSAKYNAKVVELQLLQLSGRLLDAVQ
ncbi:MAG: TolC family protein [Bacteroidota bacterium]